jgi:hypothetical protein
MRAELILKLEDGEGVCTESSLLELGLRAEPNVVQEQLKDLIVQQMPNYLPAAFEQLAAAQAEAERLAELAKKEPGPEEAPEPEPETEPDDSEPEEG